VCGEKEEREKELRLLVDAKIDEWEG